VQFNAFGFLPASGADIEHFNTERERHLRKYKYPLGISRWSPSANQRAPDQKRKLNASIFIVGCRSMKSLTLLTKMSMKIIAIIIRRHHHRNLPTIPTAVITESSEKKDDVSIRICTMTAPNVGATRFVTAPSSPSNRSWIS